MGVGLYNLSQAEITKMAMESKSVIAGKKQQNADPRMSMNGSIFPSKTAPQTPATKTTGDLPTGLVNNQNPTNPANGNETPTTTSNEGGTPSSSEGEEQANGLKGKTKELKGATKGVEDDAKEAKQIGADAKKTTKSTKKEQKNLEQQLKTRTKEYQKNTKEFAKLGETNATTFAAIQRDKVELESLTAGGDTTVFSLSLAGDEQANGGKKAGNPDQDRINEIAARLNENVSILDTGTQRMYSLQKTSDKSLKQMNKINSKYTKSVKNSQKAVKNEQAQNSKIIQIADKVSQISSTVTTAGQTLEITGKVLFQAGKALSNTGYGAAIGAAMMTAGTFCQQVGTIAQTVGNYGTMASEATKGVAFAAEGNLAGALSSITTAAAAGQSAVKSTKDMGKTMGDLKNQAMEAKQNAAAAVEAKEQVKKMQAEGTLGDVSKKAAKKDIQANIMENNDFGNSTKFKDIKANISQDSISKATEQTKTNIANASTNAQNNLTKNGITNFSNGKGKRQLTRGTNNNFKQTTAATMQNVYKNKPFLASNAGKVNFQQIVANAQTLASVFGNSGTENTSYASSSGRTRSADPAVMARLRQIQSSRTHIHAA